MNPSTRSDTATGPGDRRARLACLALILVLGWACGPPRERFRGSHASPEAVTAAFLQALEAGDRMELEGLAVSAREFQLEVFPEMPAYGNIPPDFAWSQLAAKNLYGLSTALDHYGGRAWDLEEIDVRGETTVYQTFSVHRDPMLRLRDRETGVTEELALFGSFLEWEGGYTLLSLNIDR